MSRSRSSPDPSRSSLFAANNGAIAEKLHRPEALDINPGKSYATDPKYKIQYIASTSGRRNSRGECISHLPVAHARMGHRNHCRCRENPGGPAAPAAKWGGTLSSNWYNAGGRGAAGAFFSAGDGAARWKVSDLSRFVRGGVDLIRDLLLIDLIQS